ncbi:acyl carrier protein [Mesorhizobium sp. NPDC059054]|uniref:acyl carrier protein n=1 Tax=Mesorhizobium sp. NPDC059054 TaxID=3346711 RepID=UPI0036A9E764
MADDTKTAIRAFIIENFLFGDDNHPLPDDMSLIDNDLVDSTGILELVGHIEKEFGFKVEDREIVPANLDSIARIVAYIDGKRAK